MMSKMGALVGGRLSSRQWFRTDSLGSVGVLFAHVSCRPLHPTGRTSGTGGGRHDLTLFPEVTASPERAVSCPELVSSFPQGFRGGGRSW